MVYLHGEPSQLDTFDMKPDAPAEFRGEFHPIRTNLPGLDICHLMPRMATIADKYSVVRNISFLEYVEGHNPPLVYTGYPTSTANPSHRPTFGSVVSRLRGDRVRDMPPYVAFDGYRYQPCPRPRLPRGRPSSLCARQADVSIEPHRRHDARPPVRSGEPDALFRRGAP